MEKFTLKNWRTAWRHCTACSLWFVHSYITIYHDSKAHCVLYSSDSVGEFFYIKSVETETEHDCIESKTCDLCVCACMFV